MRILFSIILLCLIAALLSCARVARRSGKSIAPSVMYLLLALVPPMAGNLILIISTRQSLSVLGCYVYFLGMDLVVLALLRFTSDYCAMPWPRRWRIAAWVLLSADALQILANPFTGHAFGIEEIVAYGAPYFRLVPYLGQTFHRILDYSIVAVVLIIFFVKTLRSPRINSERYSVILSTMVFTTAWETVYIFSRTPMDRSMIGFGVFGLLVFYFSLYYHPYRLLDRMLAAVASEIPDALFFFDLNGHCIWVNKRGGELAGLGSQDYEAVPARLKTLLGFTGSEEGAWSEARIIGSGDAMRSYVLEHRAVTDDKDRPIGSFLTVRDNSDEQKTLQREIYNATHDRLTQVYNRAGYDLLLSGMDLNQTLMLLIDGDHFKLINDRYGHETGDRTLQRIARAVERNFRSEDYVCRIGGDEFVVLMLHGYPAQSDQIRDRVRRINDELAEPAEDLPPISISVGCAHGRDAADCAALFDHADHALYETKRNGRNGVTFYTASGP